MDKKKVPAAIVYTIISSFFAVMVILVFLIDMLYGSGGNHIIKTGTISLAAFILLLLKKFFDIGYEYSKGKISVFTLVETVLILAVIVLLFI